jgi:hypothetical protein
MMRFTFFSQEIDMSGAGRLELAARLSPLECPREKWPGIRRRKELVGGGNIDRFNDSRMKSRMALVR